MWIPVENIARVCNPLVANPWQGSRKDLTDLVSQCLKNNDLLDEPWEANAPSKLDRLSFDEYSMKMDLHNARRIAYLIVYGWNDWINFDVGVPSLGCYVDWIVIDGNHRLAAAIYKGDEAIRVSIDGCLEHASHLFQIEIEEDDFEYAHSN